MTIRPVSRSYNPQTCKSDVTTRNQKGISRKIMPKPGMKENTMFISRTIASPKDLIGAGLKSCRGEVEVFLV